MARSVTEIKSLARSHTRTALATLAGVMRSPKAPPAARVAAANSLLDRGWGKATQAIAGDEKNPLRLEIAQIVRTIVDPRPTDERVAAVPDDEPQRGLAAGD